MHVTKGTCPSILLLFLATFTLLAGCGENSSNTTGPGSDGEQALEPRSFYAGVSGLIPANYPNPSDDDWAALFENLPEYGELFGMHTGWNEGELNQDNNIPVVIEVSFMNTRDTPMDTYVAVGFEPDDLTPDEADRYFEVHGDEFIKICRRIAAEYSPEIMLIGVEINRYFEKSPSGFNDFLDVYESVYQEIKNESPDTRVGSNFLLEYMRGAGARSGSMHEPHWELLGSFEPQMDLVTFTLYPFLDVDHPSEIPTEYLSEIGEHTRRPLMITETGWPSQPVSSHPDIQAGEEVQAIYLDRLLELADPVSLYALIWAFPHDPNIGLAGGLFDHISMKRNDGTPKQVFSDWEDLLSRPVE